MTHRSRPDRSSSMLSPTVAALLGLCMANIVQAEEGSDICLIDNRLGYSDPANVYQCKWPLKCCFEYSKPSCCGGKPSWQIVQEQVTLWGGLFAILLAIASIVYCRKNDLNITGCVALKQCLVRFCCGSTADDHDQEIALKVSSDQSRGDGSDTKPARHGWRNNSVNPLGDSTHIEMSRV